MFFKTFAQKCIEQKGHDYDRDVRRARSDALDRANEVKRLKRELAMANKVKRSMAVHVAAVVTEGSNTRFAVADDYQVNENGHRVYGWHGPMGYRVSRVTNSVSFAPGDALTKDEVEKLINEDWTISVLAND